MADGVTILGLRQGDAVRWKLQPSGRWHSGTVSHRERDGSVGVTDRRGHARSLPVDRLEVACTGARGARTWESLSSRAARSEQLSLLI